MSKSNFNACLAEVLKHEGGYVNDPHDPGGETNMGISKRSYPKENIKGMTVERAAQIYRRDYWDAVSGDGLPPGMDLVAFDAAVNSGVSRGSKWLQGALGVRQDGRIGPATLAAGVAADDDAAVIDKAVGERLDFLRGLSTWNRYGKGWTSRVESVRATAKEMAALGDPTTGASGKAAVSNAGIYVIGALLVVVAAYLGFK